MEGYESLGVLAAALYGDVYKLRHRATGDLVALKRMDLQAAARRRTKDTHRLIEEDLFGEIQTNLALRRVGGHRHVVALRDVFADEASVSLVTEFCAQGELLEVVNARGALLPVEDALRYFHQIVQGVAFLHAQGIAHRDLSLENVLVDEFDCCKLADFGMATTATSLRATGIGKVHYMAPEACRELDTPARAYNPFEADLWSLGVILLTLLTGEYPFDRALDSDAHFQLVASGAGAGGVAFLLEQCGFDTDGYDDVVDLLECMLAVDPSQRATAAALLEHECFDEFTAVSLVDVDETMSFDEPQEEEEDEEEHEIQTDEINPADDDEDDHPDDEQDTSDDEEVVVAPTEPVKSVVPTRPFGVGPLVSVRRPPSPIDTSSRPSCTFVRPSASSRKSAAVLKEQRTSSTSVIAVTPTFIAATRPLRRSAAKVRKKCALRGMLDGVFRRKRARTASASTGMVP